SVAPQNVCENNGVVFTDLSTVAGDTISQWIWDFGDATTDSVPNPLHQYALAGDYLVTLTSFAPTSCGSSDTMTVHVLESPGAFFNYTAVCLGTPTPFTDQSTPPPGSTIVAHLWDVGETFTDTVQNPSHLFATAGNHLVKHTVTTNFGCTNTDSVMILVYYEPTASFVNTIPC